MCIRDRYFMSGCYQFKYHAWGIASCICRIVPCPIAHQCPTHKLCPGFMTIFVIIEKNSVGILPPSLFKSLSLKAVSLFSEIVCLKKSLANSNAGSGVETL